MKSRWWKRILIAVIIVLVGLSIPVGLEYHARSQAWSDLGKIIADLDKTDPRWRLEDVEADRQPVPEENNSANTVIAAYGMFPKNPKLFDIQVELEKVPPPVNLNLDQAGEIAAALKPLEKASDIARKLKDRPFGRFKIEYSKDFLSTLVPDLYKTVEIANLLDLETKLCLHRKEMDKAWIWNRALLNVGRAIGDEPLLISTLRRLAVAESCVRNLERALGQGEFQASHLEERQNDLGDEMMVPHFLIGMRGERGGTDYFLSSIENGKISLVQTLENLGKKNPTHKPGIWDPINEFFAFSTVLRTHATLLDLHTRVIEALKLPPKNRNEALKEIDLELKEIGPKDRSHLTGLLFPNTTKIGQVEQRVHSNLACAVAALAAERFRLQKNRWPKSLAELVQAGYLKKIPIDLFDGKPLRFRRTKDGLVIYSIGPDGNYDGKALDDLRNINESVVRVEFRLWDPAHRRQPPLPPPKPEQ